MQRIGMSSGMSEPMVPSSPTASSASSIGGASAVDSAATVAPPPPSGLPLPPSVAPSLSSPFATPMALAAMSPSAIFPSEGYSSLLPADGPQVGPSFDASSSSSLDSMTSAARKAFSNPVSPRREGASGERLSAPSARRNPSPPLHNSVALPSTSLAAGPVRGFASADDVRLIAGAPSSGLSSVEEAEPDYDRTFEVFAQLPTTCDELPGTPKSFVLTDEWSSLGRGAALPPRPGRGSQYRATSMTSPTRISGGNGFPKGAAPASQSRFMPREAPGVTAIDGGSEAESRAFPSMDTVAPFRVGEWKGNPWDVDASSLLSSLSLKTSTAETASSTSPATPPIQLSIAASVCRPTVSAVASGEVFVPERNDMAIGIEKLLGHADP